MDGALDDALLPRKAREEGDRGQEGREYCMRQTLGTPVSPKAKHSGRFGPCCLPTAHESENLTPSYHFPLWAGRTVGHVSQQKGQSASLRRAPSPSQTIRPLHVTALHGAIFHLNIHMKLVEMSHLVALQPRCKCLSYPPLDSCVSFWTHGLPSNYSVISFRCH